MNEISDKLRENLFRTIAEHRLDFKGKPNDVVPAWYHLHQFLETWSGLPDPAKKELNSWIVNSWAGFNSVPGQAAEFLEVKKLTTNFCNLFLDGLPKPKIVMIDVLPPEEKWHTKIWAFIKKAFT